MHELSVAMSLVEAVEEEAARHSGRVQAIHLKLGLLSGVVKEALQSGFEMASAGTSIEGVRLVIEEVPVVVYCPRCQSRQTVASIQWFCCPVCDTPTSEVLEGKELQLVALEIDDG
jgi:hydrogenase nickel incorporation protein HypA/HybF